MLSSIQALGALLVRMTTEHFRIVLTAMMTFDQRYSETTPFLFWSVTKQDSCIQFHCKKENTAENDFFIFETTKILGQTNRITTKNLG